MAIKFYKDDRGYHSLDTATNIETSYGSEREVNYAMLVEMLRHGERLEEGLARLSLPLGEFRRPLTEGQP